MTNDPTANDAAGFSDLIGLELTDIEEGYSRGELAVTDRLRNPHGVLHGAVAYAMADTGMGAALYPGLGVRGEARLRDVGHEARPDGRLPRIGRDGRRGVGREGDRFVLHLRALIPWMAE